MHLVKKKRGYWSFGRLRGLGINTWQETSYLLVVVPAPTSVRLNREQIQLVALDGVVGFVFDSGNRLIEQHFLEERH